jgi:hypothetical protein
MVEPGALPTAIARFVALDGWRVSWSCDARSILIGERPARAGDDEPASTTRRVAVLAGGAASNAAPAQLRWIEGPSTGIGAPAPASAGPLAVRGRMIESRSGRVVVRDAKAGGAAVERDVGPGVALAATRNGHFILALAPRVGARPHESPSQAVVYRVP